MENKRHLIALDLDGTLLTDYKKVTPYTQEVISKAIEQGHIVVIATGRSDFMSLYYYDLLRLNTAMINYNGAYIHHPYDDTWGPAVHHPLPRDTALDIVDICYELDVHNIWTLTQDHILLDRHDEKIIDSFHFINQSKEPLPLTIGRIKKQLAYDPTSLIIHPREDHMKDLQSHLNDHFAEKIHYRVWGKTWNFFEISKKGMNKAYGLEQLSQYYNIPRERIIAFGDETNDLEMIEYAGIGVAMENGIDELKKIADDLTETNEEDGVAKYLEKHLKL